MKKEGLGFPEAVRDAMLSSTLDADRIRTQAIDPDSSEAIDFDVLPFSRTQASLASNILQTNGD